MNYSISSSRIYAISSSKSVQKQINRLPADMIDRVTKRISGLSSDPRPPGVQKTHAAGSFYRVREGNYRILYEIDDCAREVRLLEVEDRKDVYRGRRS